MATLADVTAADLQARYPAFAGVAIATVNACLDEARGSVGDTWIVGDQKPALLALAAHLLVGAGALTVEDGFTATGAPIAAMRAGDHELKFVSGNGTNAQVSAANSLSGTSYGQRYLELRSRSFPAVMVI